MSANSQWHVDPLSGQAYEVSYDQSQPAPNEKKHSRSEIYNLAFRYETQLARIRNVLATFYHAELSISSVAPVLALAEELNPSLAKGER